jgi:DNA polymerase-3 subunit delta
MAAQPTPRYYILHGEDELSCSETLDDLRSRLGPPELAALNTTVFDGAQVTLTELKNTCSTIPFMAERRMVVVHGLLCHLASTPDQKKDGPSNWKKRYLEELADYLPHLPETTRLVLVEPRQLPHNHPLLRQVKEDEFGYVRGFVPPKDLAQWVRQRASDKDGSFSPEAAKMLAEAIGNDQRLLDQEIDKLLSYTNCERPVTTDDVSLLVPYVQEAVIFDAVDALGMRNGVKASRLIHNLLDHGNEPRYLLAMIIRQFRLLIQVKELVLEGMDTQTIAKKIKLHPYPTRKLHMQARNFPMEQLELVHRRLLEIDVQLKTSQIDEIVALDLLIAGLAPPN